MSLSAKKNGLPRSSYAYAPTADPETWKLPYRTASGVPDPNHLPGAAAALSSGGFRGQKVDLPSSAISMVKAKLRKAYREMNKSGEMPSHLQEGDPMRESVVLLDRATDSGQIAVCPSCGDTLIIPAYDGQYDQIKNPPVVTDEPMPSNPMYDIQDAMSALQTIIRLKGNEAADNEPADMAILDDVIAGLIKFIGSENAEIVTGMCVLCDHDMACDCSICGCDSSVHTDVAESGRRHSKRDAALLKNIVEMVKSLGIEIPETVVAPPVAPTIGDATVAEADAAIVIEESAKPEDVTFTESGSMGQYVSLREADATFNPAKKEIIITPIRPGWGNAADGFYYPEQSLREAVDNGVFNGRPIKMYANHPPRKADGVETERNVWDWVSTMRETWWDNDKGRPQSRIKVYDDRFWQRAVDAPDEIAFSILGGGRSRRGRIGDREARIVESLSRIRSVDWVTEAGAGGAIEKFAESAHEEFEMDLKNLTAEQLKEANPELFAQIQGTTVETVETPETPEVPVAADAPVVEAEAEVVTEPVADASETPAVADAETDAVAVESDVVAAETPEVEAEPSVETPEAEAPVAEAETSELETLRAALAESQARLAAVERAQIEAKNRADTAEFVTSVIKESTLPAIAKEQVAGRFREATTGEGFAFVDQAALRIAVEKELADRQAIIDELSKKSKIKGFGAAPMDNPENGVRESVAKRLEDKWGPSPVPAKSSTETGVAPAMETDEVASVSEAAKDVMSSMAEKFGLRN